jgi:hypothetical protein
MGLLSQALVLVSQGKADDGQAYFEKAQQADPGNPEVLYEKAWALERQGLLPERNRRTATFWSKDRIFGRRTTTSV